MIVGALRDGYWAWPGWRSHARKLEPVTKGIPDAALGAGVKPEMVQVQDPD